jgi:hypothetical protein
MTLDNVSQATARALHHWTIDRHISDPLSHGCAAPGILCFMIKRVNRFLIDGAMIICSSCKLRAGTHSLGKKNDLCCECYIAKGGVPAVWHPACVRAYARKISNKDR